MYLRKNLSVLLFLINVSSIQLFAQTNTAKVASNYPNKGSAFYRNYLATRKKHPRVDTNLMAGAANSYKKHTFIMKQLSDESIYHSYWPLLGDTLIYVSPEAQKVCVVTEIDSCEKINREHPIKQNESDYGNHPSGVIECVFFECGIVANNITNIDFEKEKGYDDGIGSYTFRYKKNEHYRIISKKTHVLKVIDSIKKVNNYIPLSHTKNGYFNLKKGIVTSHPEAKDTISLFEVIDIIYVNNNIRYIEIHRDNNGDNEDVQLYLYTKSGLFSVTDASED